MTDFLRYLTKKCNRYFFETFSGKEDAKAKIELFKLAGQYDTAVKSDPSSETVETLRGQIIPLIERIDSLRANYDNSFKVILPRGDNLQPSLETAQTRKGKGDF